MKKSLKNKINKKNKEAGRIVSYFYGVARIKGINQCFLNEVLLDEKNGLAAVVVGFDKDSVEALFFDEKFNLEKPVFRSYQVFSISVSDSIIGRIVNGSGKPDDNFGPLRGKKIPVFREAPPIIDREPVSIPLSTGIKIIDVVLSLGRGQRELIIGDRKLGKSTLAIDVVLNQKKVKKPVYCVYVICGQKKEKLREIVSLFEKTNSFLYSTIVAATAEDSFAAQYLAPFIGCAVGEYFRDKGKDVLVVYDDLSKHAKIYRSIALLLERAPGREAYPGDIFSLHAGLLERAAKISKEKGGGSLTALPIIETQESDITSFIPTNLISITDGQIYLERGLFQKGFLPAVNSGLSVSRVGSKAQPGPLKEVVSGIRLALAQHKELQKLTQLETIISDKAKAKLKRGELTLELLKQEKHVNISWSEQVILFYAVEQGFFDDMIKEDWNVFEGTLLELVKNRYPSVLDNIEKGNFNKGVKNKIKEIVEDFKKEFLLTSK